MITPETIAENDLILTMSPEHIARIKELSPGANVHLLSGYATGDPEGRAVQDPFGGDLDSYRETADDLERELAGLLDRIPAP